MNKKTFLVTYETIYYLSNEISKMASISRPAGGDVDIGYKLEIAATVTFIAAFVVVGLRFMARMFYARLGWDDYLMIFATVCLK